MEIFIHREEGDFGPYTVEELKQYLESGDLLPVDYAWYEGAPDWMALEEVPGVMPPGYVASPAPKPARNTGLPAWIPPRRADDPDSASTTSFGSPSARPIGIRTLSPNSPNSPKSPQATPPMAPRNATRTREPEQAARSIPIIHPAPLPDDDEDLPAPLPPPGPGLRSIGTRNMIFGALWFIGGLGVTIYSYTTAFGQAHGGLYLISWGAIAGGLIQFLRGFNQARKS